MDPTGCYPNTLLSSLSCQIGKRPAGAPHFADLAPALREVRREGGQLVVTYAESARAVLAEVVAAERLCCAGIGWHLEDEAATLRISAEPAQLDVLERLVTA